MRTYTAQTFEEWRTIARQLLNVGVQPSEVRFHDRPEQLNLFEDDPDEDLSTAVSDKTSFVIGAKVPQDFLDLARSVACHRNADRFQLLYRVLWRLTTSEPGLLKIITDDNVH